MRKATEKDKIKMKEYYQKNKEKLDAKNREYYYNHRGEQLKRGHERYIKNKDKIADYTYNWTRERIKNGKIWKENKKRLSSRGKTKYFIELKPCCEICGSTNNLQRHHWDYNKPLLVNTLCKECHSIQHIKHFEKSAYGGISH